MAAQKKQRKSHHQPHPSQQAAADRRVRDSATLFAVAVTVTSTRGVRSTADYRFIDHVDPEKSPGDVRLAYRALKAAAEDIAVAIIELESKGIDMRAFEHLLPVHEQQHRAAQRARRSGEQAMASTTSTSSHSLGMAHANDHNLPSGRLLRKLPSIDYTPRYCDKTGKALDRREARREEAECVKPGAACPNRRKGVSETLERGLGVASGHASMLTSGATGGHRHDRGSTDEQYSLTHSDDTMMANATSKSRHSPTDSQSNLLEQTETGRGARQGIAQPRGDYKLGNKDPDARDHISVITLSDTESDTDEYDKEEEHLGKDEGFYSLDHEAGPSRQQDLSVAQDKQQARNPPRPTQKKDVAASPCRIEANDQAALVGTQPEFFDHMPPLLGFENDE